MHFQDNKFIGKPTSMAQDSKDTDSSSEQSFRVSTTDQTVDKASQPIKFDRDFFDQKNQSTLRLRQIIQNRQSQQHSQRKKKRDKIVAQKRKIAVMPPRSLQFESKSTILQMSQRIKQGCQEPEQFAMAVSELSDLMRNASEQQIFELIETGVSPLLFEILRNTVNLDQKKQLTQIVAILTLGQKREVNKLINSGVIKLLMTEIANSPDFDVISNSVLALGNICASDADFRNKVLLADPQIFKKLTELVSKNHFKLQSEIAYFTAVMIKSGSITVNQFEETFIDAVETMGQLLKLFHFFDESKFENNVLKQVQNQHLFQIMHSFCQLNEMELQPKTQVMQVAPCGQTNMFLKDPCMVKMPAQEADSIVNKKGLFQQILRILQFSEDVELLECTWRFIGQLCCCEYSHNNVNKFVKGGHVENNLINAIQKSLTMNCTIMSPKIMQGCIFTLSNLMADKSEYLSEILKLNLVSVLKSIWDSIIQKQLQFSQPLSKSDKEEILPLIQIKNEILYCIGNCTLGIKDALLHHGLTLLKLALDQGGLTILCSALQFKQVQTESDSLKVALDSLGVYFKFFKKAQKSKQLELVTQFGGIFEQMIQQFEIEGLDALEQCQYHADPQVYKMAQKILIKYFEIDSDNEPIIQLIKQIELQQKVDLNKNCPDHQTQNLQRISDSSSNIGF